MTLEDFMYWGECGECDEVMDESEAHQCPYCERWHCKKCYHDHEERCSEADGAGGEGSCA
jgi:hypothetical protein